MGSEMNRYAIIENGVVINIVVSDAEFAAQNGWVSLPNGFGINDLYDGSTFTKAPEPVAE